MPSRQNSKTRSQESLSNDQLASVIDHLEVSLLLIDRDFRVIWHNARLTRFLEGRQAAGYVCHEVFQRRSEVCVDCLAVKAFETGLEQSALVVREFPEIGRKHYRVVAVPVSNAVGEVDRVFEMICELRYAEQPSTELVAYKHLVNRSSDMMAVSDDKGNILAANRKLLTSLGYAETELVGTYGGNLLPDFELRNARAVAREARAVGLATALCHLKTREGDLIPVQMLLSHDRDVSVYTGIFTDVTERLRLEEEVRRRAEEARAESRRALEAVNQKDRFFRHVSHELRTPLTSVLGFAELMLEDDAEPLSPGQRASIDKVISSAHKLLSLVNDLLDLSKMDAGREEVTVSEVRMRRLVRQVAGALGPAAEAKGLWLRVHYPSLALRVQTDEGKVAQILTNLVSNAIKFTPAGGVEISLRTVDTKALIEVRDTGIGIPADELAKVFDEFYQAAASRSDHKGSGLGLSISRRLADLLGGTLSVTSEVGLGSTFTLSLPM